MRGLSTAPTPDVYNELLTNPRASRGLAILVHGLTGDTRGTWGKTPDLILAHSEYDVLLVGYPSDLVRVSPSIEHLGNYLVTLMTHLRKTYESTVLVGHSLGGLVIQAAILEELRAGKADQSHVANITHIVLYAPPLEGNDVIVIANRLGVPLSRQVRALASASDYLIRLRRDWVNHAYRPEIRAGQELHKRRIPMTIVAGLSDDIVSPTRAGSVYDAVEIVEGNHSGIKLPKDAGDLRFQVLLQRLAPSATGVQTTGVETEALNLSFETAFDLETQSFVTVRNVGDQKVQLDGVVIKTTTTEHITLTINLVSRSANTTIGWCSEIHGLWLDPNGFRRLLVTWVVIPEDLEKALRSAYIEVRDGRGQVHTATISERRDEGNAGVDTSEELQTEEPKTSAIDAALSESPAPTVVRHSAATRDDSIGDPFFEPESGEVPLLTDAGIRENIELYGQAQSWRKAEYLFGELIGPYTSQFTAEHVRALLAAVQDNAQVYGAFQTPYQLLHVLQDTQHLLPETRDAWRQFLTIMSDSYANIRQELRVADLKASRGDDQSP